MAAARFLATQLVPLNWSEFQDDSGTIGSDQNCKGNEFRLACGSNVGQQQTNVQIWLNQHVLRSFSLATGASVVIVHDASATLAKDAVPPHPIHPNCSAHTGSNACREACVFQGKSSKRDSIAGASRCPHGHLCAVFCLKRDGECFLELRLVCASNESEERFQGLVDVLQGLLRNSLPGATCFPGGHFDISPLARAAPASSAKAEMLCDPEFANPLVHRAVRHIQEHLADPELAVYRIARLLDVNPSYLSNLFAKEAGARMSRFILERRIERAKMLLATTKKQAKQVASEIGFSNASRFAQAFRKITDFTPSAWRAQSHHRT